MAIFKSEEAREIQELEQVEARIARREKRERLHRILIVGLGVLALGSLASHLFCHRR